MSELEKEKANRDKTVEDWKQRLASKEPIYHHVLDLPMKISIGPAGNVQIDSPFALMGFEQAGLQRIHLAVTASQLRAALEVLENNPGEPVEVARAQAN